MRFKFLRKIFSVVLCFLVLALSVIPVFASSPDFSIGGSNQTSIPISDSVVPIYVNYDWNFSAYSISCSSVISPVLFLNPTPDLTSSDQSIFNNNTNGIFQGFSEVSFSNFDDDRVSVIDSSVSGTYSVDYVFSASCNYYEFPTSTGVFSVSYGDFYCWTDDDNYSFNSEVVFAIDRFSTNITFSHAEIVYSVEGSTVTDILSVQAGDIGVFDQMIFNLNPEVVFDYPGILPAYFYIHDITLYFNAPSMWVDLTFEGTLAYSFNPTVRDRDITSRLPFDSENPAVPLLDYTSWLGTAASGFLDLQIFPHFTVGGLLMTIIAFACVIWFLKLFAGG